MTFRALPTNTTWHHTMRKTYDSTLRHDDDDRDMLTFTVFKKLHYYEGTHQFEVSPFYCLLNTLKNRSQDCTYSVLATSA